MSNTEITIEFEEPFIYSDENGGRYESVGVTVFTPKYEDIEHYDAISAYAKQAQIKAMEMVDSDQLEDVQELHAKGMTEKEVMVELEGEEALSNYSASFNNYKAALGANFPKLRKRLLRDLTKNKRLAVVSGTEHELTNNVWKAIGKANGVNAVDEVLGAAMEFYS